MLEKENAIIEEELAESSNARRVLQLLRNHPHVKALLEQANVVAVRRLGYNDHGPVHAEIVTANALRLMGLLEKAGVELSLAKDHKLTREDSQIVVICAAYLHDIGIAVHRSEHEKHALFLAEPILWEILNQFYENSKLPIVVAEILHAIYCHESYQCLSVEAGVFVVADGTDSTAGRSRIPIKLGKHDMHALSAQAITEVNLVAGEKKPVCIEVMMENPAGIFQIEEVLLQKLKLSGLEKYVEIVARLKGSKDDIKEVRFSGSS